jgi:hypothetical protein
MFWTHHYEFIKEADLNIPFPVYLGSAQAPYLVGGKLIRWDFYSLPAVYSRAPKTIIARYGEAAMNFLAYPSWLIVSQFYTTPHCFDFVDF